MTLTEVLNDSSLPICTVPGRKKESGRPVGIEVNDQLYLLGGNVRISGLIDGKLDE